MYTAEVTNQQKTIKVSAKTVNFTIELSLPYILYLLIYDTIV